VKVILSRKGFDSGCSSHPSPILHDGTLLSFPIPAGPDSEIKYSDITTENKVKYSVLLEQLGIKRPNPQGFCHLDPDIRKCSFPREKGWKPIFGQAGAAQTHLANNGVKEGDLFLFFGWFKNTLGIDAELQFDQADKHGKHVIFGYLQIGKIINTKINNVSCWAGYHHHTKPTLNKRDNNTLYIATDHLSWNQQLKGAGVFKLGENLILTKRGSSRSTWELPKELKGVDITYHTRQNWQGDIFKAASRGQEFVIAENPKVERWAKSLFENAAQ